MPQGHLGGCASGCCENEDSFRDELDDCIEPDAFKYALKLLEKLSALACISQFPTGTGEEVLALLKEIDTFVKGWRKVLSELIG